MILLGLTGASVTAHATEPPAERARVVLEYARSGAALKTCPDEATFRALVAARLGYDVFVDGSTSDNALTLRVEFRSRGPLVAGSLALTAHGVARGDRTMNAAPADCYELGASLALAAAVAVDPEGALARKTAAAPEQPPPSSGQAPPSASITPAPTSPERPPPSSSTPPPPLRPPVPAAEKPKPAGFLHAGAIVTVDVCAVASAGALFSHAEGVTRSRPVTDLYTTVGARVGLTLRASDSVGFAVDAEAPFALSRVHLLVDDAGVSREAWVAGRVGFIGGARVMLTFH